MGMAARVALALVAACGALPARPAILCSGTSPEGITVTLRLDSPDPGATVVDVPPCDGRAVVMGAATALDRFPPFDVLLVVDSSGSTGRCTGQDVDGDLLLGAPGPGDTCSDPGDSVLSAELTALRGLLGRLRGLDVRAGLVEFSAVLPAPGPGEQGRIRVVRGVTADLDAVEAGLGEVLAAGSGGATDYAGALDAAIGEAVRSRAAGRELIAFFLTDGKPTFPRYPYDSTENQDTAASLAAARRAAAAGVAIHAYEIGQFDDRGLLDEIAAITGGTSVDALDPATLVRLLPEARLTGIEEVVLVNDTTGVEVVATLNADGTFSAEVPLAPDYNRLHAEVTPVGGTRFDLSCSASVLHRCLPEELCFRETTDAMLHDLLARSADLASSVGAATTCEGLRATDGDGPCAVAVREYLAAQLNVLDGRLGDRCVVDTPDGAMPVDAALALVEALLDRGACAEAAALAQSMSSGDAITQAPLPDPSPVECAFEDPVTGLDVTITITSPVMGDGLARRPCDGLVPVEGRADVSNLSNLFDLFFVIDSSGSTSAASGRDIDQDGFLGTGPSYANTDPGDSVLEAELEAVRLFVEDLDPAWARVAIIQFSNPDNFFGRGELQRIVQPLTDDFALVEAALQAISAGGSNGATDYGGALRLLDQEYVANADPANRTPICFFLSDGIPTWPEPPYDETQPPDRAAAIAGAITARGHGIEINTYEVGPAGAADILTEMSDITGGRFFPSLVAGDVVQVLNEFNLVGIASVTIENVTSGEAVPGAVADDGAFAGTIGLLPGMNALRVTVVTDSGEPVTATCLAGVEMLFANLLCSPLNAATWAGECVRATVPEPRLPLVRAGRAGVELTIEPVPLVDGHRVYRGSLDLLHSGTYAHVSPFSGDPSTPECLLPPGVTTFTDAGALADGNDWYYLVAPVLGGLEGSHGRSDRAPRLPGTSQLERPRPGDDPADLVETRCP